MFKVYFLTYFHALETIKLLKVDINKISCYDLVCCKQYQYFCDIMLSVWYAAKAEYEITAARNHPHGYIIITFGVCGSSWVSTRE